MGTQYRLRIQNETNSAFGISYLFLRPRKGGRRVQECEGMEGIYSVCYESCDSTIFLRSVVDSTTGDWCGGKRWRGEGEGENLDHGCDNRRDQGHDHDEADDKGVQVLFEEGRGEKVWEMHVSYVLFERVSGERLE